MKRLSVVVSALGILSGCALNPKTCTTETVKLKNPSIHLIGRFAAAHACPISATLALSAAHVADLVPFENTPLYPYRWSDDDGHEGVIAPSGVDNTRDLASFCYHGGDRFSYISKLATEAPKPGDTVHIFGYDWRGRKAAYSLRVWDLHVTRIVAGHIIMDDTSERGSSGSCVVNDAGEVVGIMSRMTPVEGVGEHYAGVVVGVWGDLVPKKQLFCPERDPGDIQ